MLKARLLNFLNLKKNIKVLLTFFYLKKTYVVID
jgi:hypothetical protein